MKTSPAEYNNLFVSSFYFIEQFSYLTNKKKKAWEVIPSWKPIKNGVILTRKKTYYE